MTIKSDSIAYTASNGEVFVFDSVTGIGHLPSNASNEMVYDEQYWNNYVQRSNTPIGWALNGARMHLVDQAASYLTIPNPGVVDIGIGSGAFVQRYPCLGYDVNPCAVQWLKDQSAWVNPYNTVVDVITMWDVIEHIEDPTDLLNNVSGAVVLSTPIYRSFEHCINSKHFKPNEHIWYFTDNGIKHYMQKYGFECVYQDTREIDCGREDIGSYIFVRN